MSLESSPSFSSLVAEASSLSKSSLRELLASADRNQNLVAHVASKESEITLDYSRQLVRVETLKLLEKLAEERNVKGKIEKMFKGEILNETEGRAVGHVALRMNQNESFLVNGENVVKEVVQTRQKIIEFCDKVRNGVLRGATGQLLTDVVAIGIGGSYLGAEFVSEALSTDPKAMHASKGRKLRFLSNVDPVAIARATDGLKPENTLVIVISKTFTTAETMLNARSMKKWLVDALGNDCTSKHVAAISSDLKLTKAFGIDEANVFAIWDWVGGRYSVSSAVGVLPLSLQYGNEVVGEFLAGARSIDQHFLNAPLLSNIPAVLGLIGIWNATFLNHSCRALLPYSQALHKFAPHIQQVDMESNGKRVAMNGSVLTFPAGPINFGEPGTNGQHSFYQLIHQGRTVPCDFIGFCKSQFPVHGQNEVVSNHDELMSNFFAQPDALAYGKTEEELRAEMVPDKLIPHKVFSGNRPSSSLLFDELNAFTTGQLLAIFEHRTIVEGFIWGINSFDQWGVELGKVLAGQVRSQLHKSRTENAEISDKFNSSTKSLLKRYLSRL